MLNHKKDFTYAQFQIQQNFKKYSLQDKTKNKFYESPQFVFMRVAMQMALNKTNRLEHIKNFYYFYSNGIINIPTPYFVNSGTKKYSYISCCLYRTKDTVESLATGDHIAYTMTYSSAGIGSAIHTRTLNDPIRGGLIKHQGKLPYYRALVGAIKANLQNGRGGAATVTYYCYDPEVLTIQKLKNPLTPASKQIRGLDYCMAFNRFFVEQAAQNENIALFSIKEAPDVYEAISKDTEYFKEVYDKAVKENRYHSFISAREILVNALMASIDTGRHYYLNLTESNHHTPFKEPIIMTNLCLTGDTEIIVKTYNSKKEIKMSLKDVVESPENFKVKSFNHEKNKEEFKEITNKALMKKETKILKITDSETGKFIKCIPEHRVYTKNRGYVMAKDLTSTDELLIN
jgi:ribonucleoside-diphosphate reductase alpha chain